MVDNLTSRQEHGVLIFWTIAVLTSALAVWGYKRLGKKKVRPTAPKKEPTPTYIEGARRRAAERAAAAALVKTQPPTPAPAPPSIPAPVAPMLYERMGMEAAPPPPASVPTPVPVPPAPAPAPEPAPLSAKEAFKKALAEHNAKIGRAQKEHRRSAPVEQYHSTLESTREEPTYAAVTKRALDKPRLRITYRDRHGEVTRRYVDVISYDLAVGSMEAYCQLRRAQRTFYFDSIQDAIDLETGEYVPDFPKYFEDIYRQSPKYAIDQFADQHGDALFVLFCMAKADGKLMAKERRIILGYAQEHGLAPDQEDGLMDEIKDWDATTRTRFHNAVRAVKADNTHDVEALFAACVQIVQSDKAAHSDEVRMLIYAAKQWGLPVPDWLQQHR